MKSPSTYLLLLLLCLPGGPLFAQWDGFVDERKFRLRVKQIDEFMERFNGTDGTATGMTVAERTRYLRNLFDVDRFRDARTGDLNSLGKRFIGRVLADSVQIHFEDTCWQAEVLCEVLVRQQPEQITLVLRPERIRPYEYKWTVREARGAFFDRFAQRTDSAAILSPIEHETGFIGLMETTQVNGKHWTDYCVGGFVPDRLTVISLLAYYGLLQIVQPLRVVYVFRNVPGYTFTVERSEKRDSYNTGWLISSLTIDN